MTKVLATSLALSAFMLAGCGGVTPTDVPAPLSSEEAHRQFDASGGRLVPGVTLEESARQVCAAMMDEAQVRKGLTGTDQTDRAGIRVAVAYKCPEHLATFDAIAASLK